MDRASFQMDGLAGAEGLFDLRQIFVAVMHFLRGSGAHREIGLDHITAIELGGLFASGRVHTQHQGSPLYCDLQPSIDFQLLDPGAQRQARVGELKESMARNKEALSQYT
jgi:hypothetical protein